MSSLGGFLLIIDIDLPTYSQIYFNVAAPTLVFENHLLTLIAECMRMHMYSLGRLRLRSGS